jgi:hypothetical protein
VLGEVLGCVADLEEAGTAVEDCLIMTMARISSACSGVAPILREAFGIAPTYQWGEDWPYWRRKRTGGGRAWDVAAGVILAAGVEEETGQYSVAGCLPTLRYGCVDGAVHGGVRSYACRQSQELSRWPVT